MKFLKCAKLNFRNNHTYVNTDVRAYEANFNAAALSNHNLFLSCITKNGSIKNIFQNPIWRRFFLILEKMGPSNSSSKRIHTAARIADVRLTQLHT